ncbi:MAG TPA: serine--tRNA ligase [Actinomycetota bacterium]
MLDLKMIRERPDEVRAALARRGGTYPIDETLAADAERRAVQTRLDQLRSQQKAASAAVGKASSDERPALLEKAKALSEEVKAAEEHERELAARARDLMLGIPNLPHPTAPDGHTEEEADEVRREGLPPAFDFEVRDHLQIGETLDMIDVERGARTSGSRFAYLKGQIVLLEFALVRYAMGKLSDKGFTPVVPPVLVRREAMEGTGFLPTDEAQIYTLPEDDLYLVGTSEVPLAAMHQDEYLPADALPLRYAGFSTCFRREAGTYGKDTRGIFRVHQFDKVEMFSFTTPEQSWDEHEFLLSVEEEILQELQIPYRVMNIAAGDLGQPAAKKYDVEAWMPGQAAYREVTSCSNCTDYQARRLNCRIKTDSGPQFVHTLNGTAVAIGRMLIAIMENNQREDGSVHVPHPLVGYAGFELLGPTP